MQNGSNSDNNQFHQSMQEAYEFDASNVYASGSGGMPYSIMPGSIEQQMTASAAQEAADLDASMPLGYQDSAGSMWSNNMMAPLITSFDQMGDFTSAHPSAHPSSVSPVLNDSFPTRRSSAASAQDGGEWQDKVRSERRKVQNRAAQRAYRERKEKALSDLRDLLDQKESQYQSLQQDHKELQQKYDRLVSDTPSSASTPSTCNPRLLLRTTYSDDSIPESVPESEEG